ncbi:MAG: glycosyltransferase family 4 protein [Methanophagales archaeon]|nr:glycosyltransferase family 4 protein [Methanophagales archaeon]
MKQNEEKEPKVCVIVFPSHWLTNRLFLSDLMRILEPITDQLYLISGNLPRKIFTDKLCFIDIGSPPSYNKTIFGILISFLRIIGIQLKESLHLFKIIKDVDVVVFYLNYFYQLPLLLAKICRKKTMLLQTNTISKEAIASSSLTSITRKLSPIIIKANCALSDYIVPESQGLAQEYKEFSKKVLLYGARFVDLNLYKMTVPVNERRNVVGYIGRLSKEKGVLNFVNAIPLILKKRGDIEFLINGDGGLFKEIEEKISQYPQKKVRLTRWRPREEVPDCLNELKLLLLPSYTEGLPTRVLEAMSCGSPVLATPVGAVPDVVKDSQTGFIMKDNSPECIAENVIRALEYPFLDQIVKNARNLIKQKYTYEAAVERYKEILSRVMGE